MCKNNLYKFIIGVLVGVIVMLIVSDNSGKIIGPAVGSSLGFVFAILLQTLKDNLEKSQKAYDGLLLLINIIKQIQGVLAGNLSQLTHVKLDIFSPYYPYVISVFNKNKVADDLSDLYNIYSQWLMGNLSELNEDYENKSSKLDTIRKKFEEILINYNKY